MPKKTKRKNPAAAALGRLGGLAKVKKGFAMMDPAKLAELRKRGADARRKPAKD